MKIFNISHEAELSLTPMQQVLIALRFYATVSFERVIYASISESLFGPAPIVVISL